jgi:mono/diheme cytochrome c family protein
MKRRIWTVLLGVAFLGLVAFVGVTWRSAIRPTQGPPPGGFPTDAVVRGERLAAVGHCEPCHTRPGGAPYAGGYGINTPFGIIYGTNITPDPDTGIGRWSLDVFTRAMREGVRRDGSHLFPAFPYWAFTRLADADISALYAFCMTRPAVKATVPVSTLPLPLRIRALQGGWKLLFFRPERFRPDPSKNEEWNRGAYLAEALGDCSGCHSPRNALGGEQRHRRYAGTLIDGWIAPALTQENTSPVPWTTDELFAYLRTGSSPLHGATASTMTMVIRNALDRPVVPDSDVRAIAVYFSDLGRANVPAARIESITRTALSTSLLGPEDGEDPGAILYAGACLGCHSNSGAVPLAARPELALNSALTLATPTNFIQVVLQGVGANDGARGLTMPAYASAMSDAQIAALAAYLRRTRTQLPAWSNLESQVAAARRANRSDHP